MRASAGFQTRSAPAIRNPLGAAPSDVVRPLATFVKRTLIAAPSRTAAANVGPDAITSRAVDQLQRRERQPPADLLLLARVDVVRVADVQRHRHRRPRLAQRQRLRLAQLRPRALARRRLRLLLLEVRELHEQKRQLRIVPGRAPGADHRREQRAVLRRAFDVALALVPDDARDRQRPRAARPARSTARSGWWDRRCRAASAACSSRRPRASACARPCTTTSPRAAAGASSPSFDGATRRRFICAGVAGEPAAAEVIEHAHREHVAAGLHQPAGDLVVPRRRPVLRRLRAGGADALAVPVGDVEVVDRAQRQRQVAARPRLGHASPRAGTRPRRRSRRPAFSHSCGISIVSHLPPPARAQPGLLAAVGLVLMEVLRLPGGQLLRQLVVQRGVASSRDRAPRPSAPASARRAAPRAASTPRPACRPPTPGRCRRERRARGAARARSGTPPPRTPAALAASQARHSPPTFVAGVAAGGFATVNSRSPEQPSAAASAPPFDRCSGNSMLDWPDATHTSPAQTSVNVSAFVAPRIFNVYGPPGGQRRQRHRPAPVRVRLRGRLRRRDGGGHRLAGRRGAGRRATAGRAARPCARRPAGRPSLPRATAAGAGGDDAGGHSSTPNEDEGASCPGFYSSGSATSTRLRPRGLGAVHGRVGQAQERALAAALRAARAPGGRGTTRRRATP